MRRALLCTALLLAATPAHGQILSLGDSARNLTLGGYVRSLTGLHDAGYDLLLQPRRTGFNAEVVRLKWEVRSGTRYVLRVHNRLQARITSSVTSSAAAVGFGVTTPPARTVDLETELLNEPGLRVWHDLDRLSFSVYRAGADLTVGRQAITWGAATLFPVADLWAQFSPFELDTEEKPGIDAVRVLTYPGERTELDVVLADRGSRADASFGLRASLSTGSADLYAAGGKFWDELIAAAGATRMFAQSKLRLEAALPYDLETDALQAPRITAGFDWLSGTAALSAEYHFNGMGATRSEAYVARAAAKYYRRGESYLLGRHYGGVAASWTPDREQRASLALTALANAGDPSAALIPLFSYDFGQSTSVSLGGLLSLGGTPRLLPLPPRLRSEYGAYGDMLFTRLSVYF